MTPASTSERLSPAAARSIPALEIGPDTLLQDTLLSTCDTIALASVAR